MEQLKHLGGRLLGKKCVATILGLLGLCGPSSLWAEKLDTTFVLDMVIDSTPCYYTKYNNAGQIVDYGIYRNGGTVRNYGFGEIKNDYYRINTGYVTNEKGDKMNILYYTCDNVTKQWFPNNNIGKRFAYHDNGMLSEAQYADYTIAEAHHQWDPETDEEIDSYWIVPDHTLENKFRPDGYRLSLDYVNMIYGTDCGHPWEDVEEEEHNEYDSLGNAYLHNYYDVLNTYDDRQNLISFHTIGGYFNAIEEYTYDSLDRRIKTVRYDSTEAGFVMKDSIVYTYGNSLKEGEPCILSTFRISQPIDGFSSDQFHYDFSSIVTYKDFIFITPFKTSVEKSFDPETSTLSVIVKGANYAYDSTDVNTYTFALKKMESYITAMSFNNKMFGDTYDGPVEDFSSEKYSYDTFEDYYMYYLDEYVALYRNDTTMYLHYRVSEGAEVEDSYDAQTGIVTIIVKGGDYAVNPTNTHTYTFTTRKVDDAYISSVRIKGNDLSGFSPEKSDYEMPLNYIWSNTWGDNSPFSIGSSDFVFSVYPGFLFVDKSYDDSTHTLICSIYKNSNIYNTYRFHFQPCLTSINVEKDSTSLPLADFSPDKLDYEMLDIYKDFPFNYIVGKGTIVKESFNDSTNTLTLSVFHSEDSSRVTEYHIHFIHPSISSLTINGEALDTFSADVHDYWFDTEYNPDVVSYTLPDGVAAMESFDDSTNVLSIRLATDNTSEMVEYKLHFRPTDGVDDFLGDQVSLYVTDKTICVDGAEEPISVYNLLGTLVGTGRGEEVRIPVPQTGVYVVKVGGKAAKVVVR